MSPSPAVFRNHAAHQEHQAWREVCGYLLETGAVTQADLESQRGLLDTPGQRLLESIRDWGDALVKLDKVNR